MSAEQTPEKVVGSPSTAVRRGNRERTKKNIFSPDQGTSKSNPKNVNPLKRTATTAVAAERKVIRKYNKENGEKADNLEALDFLNENAPNIHVQKVAPIKNVFAYVGKAQAYDKQVSLLKEKDKIILEQEKKIAELEKERDILLEKVALTEQYNEILQSLTSLHQKIQNTHTSGRESPHFAQGVEFEGFEGDVVQNEENDEENENLVGGEQNEGGDVEDEDVEEHEEDSLRVRYADVEISENYLENAKSDMNLDDRFKNIILGLWKESKHLYIARRKPPGVSFKQFIKINSSHCKDIKHVAIEMNNDPKLAVPGDLNAWTKETITERAQQIFNNLRNLAKKHKKILIPVNTENH
ncbi:uncharacterized protein LOC122497697 isoform X2 [Leptopilina heterotoma]|uniref:uncharacterized protein LOC122497697 isoform X2 n=1 Tax=Leptopilina heterotoma TaxID=63436 RepID=UPI001CA991D8|nr:uncharacterized protein LOC122497697 isoform X2 [Leptopilina heterotoma]